MPRRKEEHEVLPKRNPAEPPDYTEPQAQAIRALSRGTASGHQQRVAIDWIIQTAACTYDLSYRPGDQGMTNFAEGKRFVGLAIVHILNAADTSTDPDKIATREMEHHNADEQGQ